MTKARILIVEDELLVAEDVRRKLLRLGYEVPAMAITGQEAVALAAETRPDLVLMDVELPGEMNGVGAADEIRAEFDIPIVYLTAHSDEDTLARAKATGPFGYVLKPFETRDLRTTIEMALYKYAQEKKIRESEERYRSLFDSVPVGLYRTTPEGEIVDVNPALVEMLGYPDRATLLAKRVGDCYHDADDRARWQAAMERNGAVRNFEMRIHRYDGTVIWVQDSARAIHDAEGGVCYYDGVIEDITERLRAESQREAALDALRKSEANLARAQQIAHLGNWNWDVQKGELTWSDEAYSIFGVEQDFDLTYEAIEALIHPEDWEKNQQFVDELLAAADSAEIEFRLIRPDGEIRHIHQSAEVWCDDAGQATQIFGIMQDITERVQAETQRQAALEALHRQEKEVRVIADNVPALVSYVDREGRYRFANQRYEEWFGIPLSEIVGKHYREVIGKASYEVVKDRVEAALSGQRVRYKAALPYTHGGVRWVQADYVPDVDANQEVNGFFALVTDITERVRAEAQREAALDELRHSLARTERSRQMWLALNQAAQAVQRARTPDEVYRVIEEQVHKLGHYAAILLLSEDRSHLIAAHLPLFALQMHGVDAWSELLKIGDRFPLAPESFYERIIAAQETLLTHQIGEHLAETILSSTKRSAGQVAEQLGVEQAILAPLSIGRKVQGLLVVAGAGLTEADLPAVTAFANQASIALENARLFEQVHAARQRLATLSRRLIDAQEIERRHLARELHDEIGQALTILKINLQTAQRLADDGEIASHLKESIRTVSGTLEQVRSLSLDLRPSLLDDLGLVPALRWYLDRQAQHAGFATHFSFDPLDEPLAPEVEITCFRIAQEALTNVLRHAEAQAVHVELRRRSDDLLLIIRDDGQGFDVAAARRAAVRGESAGLLGMEERVQILGGQIEIDAAPGAGTEIRVRFPQVRPATEPHDREASL